MTNSFPPAIPQRKQCLSSLKSGAAICKMTGIEHLTHLFLDQLDVIWS